MIRMILKAIFVAIITAIIIYELRLLARLVGPEIEPFWTRARDAVRSRGWFPDAPKESKEVSC